MTFLIFLACNNGCGSPVGDTGTLLDDESFYTGDWALPDRAMLIDQLDMLEKRNGSYVVIETPEGAILADPEDCTDRYLELREQGLAPNWALPEALFRPGSCIPGVDTYLETGA